MANNTVKKLLGIALAIVALAGCSSTQKSWEAVAAKAGFDEVTVMSGNDEIGYWLYGTAGTCQIRLFAHPGENRLYATVPGSQDLGSSDFVGDPSVALLRTDPRFETCFVAEDDEGVQAP
ncbi:hypothetical protein EOL73_01630 [Candidatus Saccharibacteria bacterium]|nr:hypothetical protein [Candidatus Saccharibacteria bacterium]NCU40437.1 hypothetical protein [Candidatus Saccharibacteria bacterium]